MRGALKGKRERSIAFEGYMFKFMVAEALVRTGRGGERFESFENRASLVHKDLDIVQSKVVDPNSPEMNEYKEQWEYFRRMAFLSSSGECLVRKNPTKALEYILSVPASDVEATLVAGYWGDIASCAPADVREHFTPPTLRAVLAWNYVRLAHAPVLIGRQTQVRGEYA